METDTDIRTTAAHFAAREETAIESFIEYATTHAGLSRAQALAAWSHLVKLKLAKIDRVMGAFRVRHGVFLEPDVLRRAAEAGEKKV